MPFDIPAAITAASSLVNGVINRIWPDPTEEEKNQLEQVKVALDAAMQSLQGQFAVIIAEAQGGGMLQRNWRPITMLVFLTLIVAHFFGFESATFTASDSEHLFSLVELGLGGYVIGRSVEKALPGIIKAVRNKD